MSSLARLQKELQQVTENLDDYKNIIHNLEPIESIYHWKAVLIGPVDTPYENGLFELDLTFSEQYPFKPPKVLFKTKIFHPNICSGDGSICNLILGDGWSPGYTILTTCTAIYSMLSSPDWNGYLVPAIGTLSICEYTRLAKKWTEILLGKRPIDEEYTDPKYVECNYLGHQNFIK
jgi:ubiquitin-conjugating enzyme E2 D/E